MSRVLAISLVFLVLTTGCMNKATGTRSADFDIKNINHLYVEHQPRDKRNINEMIKSELEKRGFSVTTGSKLSTPKDIDGLVTYIDKWQWDMTNYMLELSIFIKNPSNEFPMASGYSMHTSLSRKSPEEMVKEVVANMLGEGEAK